MDGYRHWGTEYTDPRRRVRNNFNLTWHGRKYVQNVLTVDKVLKLGLFFRSNYQLWVLVLLAGLSEYCNRHWGTEFYWPKEKRRAHGIATNRKLYAKFSTFLCQFLLVMLVYHYFWWIHREFKIRNIYMKLSGKCLIKEAILVVVIPYFATTSSNPTFCLFLSRFLLLMLVYIIILMNSPYLYEAKWEMFN